MDSRLSRFGARPGESTVSIRRKPSRAGFEPGTSTYGQTLFNTVAVIIGVGLLSESLAFYYAGWALGSILLLFFAVLTNYTSVASSLSSPHSGFFAHNG